MRDFFAAPRLQEAAEARFWRKRLRLAGDNSAALTDGKGWLSGAWGA